MSDSDGDIVKDFLVESYENLDRWTDLVGLRKPARSDALAGVFRTIHHIKGTCGFLGFPQTGKGCNLGELLTRLGTAAHAQPRADPRPLLGMVMRSARCSAVSDVSAAKESETIRS